MLTHYTVIAVRRYLVREAIATRTIIVLFGIGCEGRDPFFYVCVKGDRILRNLHIAQWPGF